MLKKLRSKFVAIMMSFVTIMLVVIFGLIIFFSERSQQLQTEQMMQALAEDPFQQNGPSTDEDVHLPYFVVQINYRGEIVVISGNSYDLSDEDTILEVTQAVLALDSQSGVLEEYSLRYRKALRPNSGVIIFADISSQNATMSNLVKICLLTGVLSFTVFLFLSIFLSRWAIKPVEKAWEQQRQFIADASHELKTPLTVIMTNAELLQSAGQEPEAQQRFSASILTMSKQMRGLVEGLLELTRVDNGAVKTSFETVDWSTLVSDGVLPFEPLYFEKGLMLRTEISPYILVRGSQQHLRQVLEILLDNAMKYADPQSEVCVTLHRQGSHGLLAVASQGAEIQPEDLKNIFKRFYRVDKARSRDGSYGLGLSIAESIVRDHGGRIWAESAKGVNTFFVQISTI